MPDYIIGDVQGCYSSLKQLLNKIQFSIDKDRLFFLGDVVNRGDESLKTLSFIKDLGSNAEMVLGNHDFHLLVCALTKKRQTKNDTFSDILESKHKHELIDYLLAKPLMIDLNGSILVHAGVPPIWDKLTTSKQALKVQTALQSSNVSEFLYKTYNNKPETWSDDLKDLDDCIYTINALLRMRFCKQDGSLEFIHKGNHNLAPEGYKAWFFHEIRLTDGVDIFFGHWSRLDLVGLPHIYPMDRGCFWGQSLSAIRLEDKKIFSVSCG
jgi:bis(5'-nucleosyl)-tetraphosphatase (symmetrical)